MSTQTSNVMDKNIQREFQQERLLVDVAALIYKRMKKAGINRTQLAELLGVSKGRVTQYLCGDCNLRLRTIADIFTALDSKLQVDSVDIHQQADSWEPLVVADQLVLATKWKIERRKDNYNTLLAG